MGRAEGSGFCCSREGGVWGGCGEAVRERREEGEEGGGREGEEGGGHEEPRSPGWSLPWLFHLPVQGPDGVTMGLGSKTTWMTSQGAVSERGGTKRKGGPGQARALRNSGRTLGRTGLLCCLWARPRLSPHPPAGQTGPSLVLPKGGRPSQPQTLTPRGPAACLLPCVRGQAEQTGVCPPRFCLQLCPLAQPDYLTMVEVPGPPQRLHPPPPPHGCTRTWGKGAESQTGEPGWMWLSEQRLQCVTEFSYKPPLGPRNPLSRSAAGSRHPRPQQSWPGCSSESYTKW